MTTMKVEATHKDSTRTATRSLFYTNYTQQIAPVKMTLNQDLKQGEKVKSIQNLF